MNSEEQVSALSSAGAMLRAAREAQDLSQREVAERLFWLPSYIDIIENNDYAALRSPLLARGYVRAYARMLEIDTQPVLEAFDRAAQETGEAKEVQRKPMAALPAQKAGLAIALSLGVLVLVVFFLWWGRSDAEPELQTELVPSAINQQPNSVIGEP